MPYLPLRVLEQNLIPILGEPHRCQTCTIDKISVELSLGTRSWQGQRGVYPCWRYSGAKLKEIGELHGISGSGVNCACRRFENMMKNDKDLGEGLQGLTGNLKQDPSSSFFHRPFSSRR